MTKKSCIYAYEVAYLGNANCALATEPKFTSLQDAKAYAAMRDGRGLRYGAFVRKFRVTREDIARSDKMRAWVKSKGYLAGEDPAHIARAREVLL